MKTKPVQLDVDWWGACAPPWWRRAYRWLLGLQSDLTEYVQARPCERCGEFGLVKKEPARTMYDWDGKGVDPNRPICLCRACAYEHHAHWDEMWDEYYSGCR